MSLTVTADAGGSMETRITWPSSAHTTTTNVPFAAVGNTTKLIAKSTYLVVPTLLTTTTDEIDVIGNAGDTIQFDGKNFAAGEKVSLPFNAKVVFTGVSRKDGSFTASVVVPPLQDVSNGAGNVQVKATGAISGLVIGLYYPDLVTFYYQPTLILTPTSGPTGTTITVTGAHFSASDSLPIGWDGLFNPDPQLSGYPAGTYELVSTDQYGNFTATIQADNLVSGQTYHVTASNFSTDPNVQATATFVAQ